MAYTLSSRPFVNMDGMRHLHHRSSPYFDQNGPLCAVIRNLYNNHVELPEISALMQVMEGKGLTVAMSQSPALTRAFETYVSDAKRHGATEEKSKEISRRNFLLGAGCSVVPVLGGGGIATYAALDESLGSPVRDMVGASGVMLAIMGMALSGCIGASQAKEDRYYQLAKPHSGPIDDVPLRALVRKLDNAIGAEARKHGVAYVEPTARGR